MVETVNASRARNQPLAVIDGGLSIKNGTPASPTVPKLKLLDQVREAIRTRHYSYMTEKAYIHWIKRFILFHNKRHPGEMGEAEIGRFLSAHSIRRNPAPYRSIAISQSEPSRRHRDDKANAPA